MYKYFFKLYQNNEIQFDSHALAICYTIYIMLTNVCRCTYMKYFYDICKYV